MRESDGEMLVDSGCAVELERRDVGSDFSIEKRDAAKPKWFPSWVSELMH